MAAISAPFRGIQTADSCPWSHSCVYFIWKLHFSSATSGSSLKEYVLHRVCYPRHSSLSTHRSGLVLSPNQTHAINGEAQDVSGQTGPEDIQQLAAVDPNTINSNMSEGFVQIFYSGLVDFMSGVLLFEAEMTSLLLMRERGRSFGVPGV